MFQKLTQLLNFFGSFFGMKVVVHAPFAGVRFGVSFAQPNGAVSELDAEVTNLLLAKGGECVPTNRTAVRDALKGLDVFGTTKVSAADVVVTGTVVETVYHFGKKRFRHTEDFILWTKAYFPEAVNRLGEIVTDYLEFRYKCTLQEIQRSYQEIKGTSPVEWNASNHRIRK